jgi:hypothetical protein
LPSALVLDGAGKGEGGRGTLKVVLNKQFGLKNYRKSKNTGCFDTRKMTFDNETFDF